MNNWFCKKLGDGLTSAEALAEIETLFQSQLATAGNPEDLAVFIRHESIGHLHCEVVVYFPPGAMILAKSVDAMPCPKPTRDNLGLLHGSEAAWLFLFPDE